MITQRRNFLVSLFSGIVAAPAIVRASSLMPIRPSRRAFGAPQDKLLRAVPRCEICFGPYGMCKSTGGPLSYTCAPVWPGEWPAGLSPEDYISVGQVRPRLRWGQALRGAQA
jgi:hypothetical protein